MKDLQKQLQEYLHAKSILTFAKEDEMRLRKDLAATLLKGKHVGTHTFIEGDYIVKATKKVATSIDKETLEAMFDDFSNEERECISFKPSLIMKEYKALDLEHREYLDMCIVVKPSLPSINVVYNGES